MRNATGILLTFLVLALFISGCDLVGDVLEFGFWAGVILILLVIGAIWLVVRLID